jgi:hypothetical protein
MSTKNWRDPAKERFWRTTVRQWRRSGLSVRAFCQQQCLSEPNFYAWRRILAERQAEGVHFVPVKVATEPRSVPAANGSASGLELVLGRGRVLRVGAGFDADTLQRLLAVLEEGRP